MRFGGRNKKLRQVMLLTLSLAVLLWGGFALASTGGEGHGAEGHGKVEEKGWAATDTYRVMNFAVLAIALIFLLKKPLSQALSGRIDGIRAQLDELESKKAAAEKELAGYNARIAELSKEADGIVAEYVRQGNEAKARILKEAEASARKLEEQSRRNIENEFAIAKQRLQQGLLENAMAKAEEIIRKGITAEDQNRLVDEYLDKVVAS